MYVATGLTVANKRFRLFKNSGKSVITACKGAHDSKASSKTVNATKKTTSAFPHTPEERLGLGYAAIVALCCEFLFAKETV